MESLKEWWAQASLRDQLSLLVLAICTFLFAMFKFILFPVIEMRENQETRVAAQESAYERVKLLATRWKNRDGNHDFSQGAVSVERVVESSFAKHGVRVSGFDASGRTGIRVRFDDVNYENLIAWLYDLEITQNIRLKDVSVVGSSDPGLVSASILIQKN